MTLACLEQFCVISQLAWGYLLCRDNLEVESVESLNSVLTTRNAELMVLAVEACNKTHDPNFETMLNILKQFKKATLFTQSFNLSCSLRQPNLS